MRGLKRLKRSPEKYRLIELAIEVNCLAVLMLNHNDQVTGRCESLTVLKSLNAHKMNCFVLCWKFRLKGNKKEAVSKVMRRLFSFLKG
jgi:hypothetical protein